MVTPGRSHAVDVTRVSRTQLLPFTWEETYSSQASAQDLVRRLQNRNLGGRAFYAPSLGLWRVQAGPFNSLNRAEDLSDELNRQYPGNFVVAD